MTRRNRLSSRRLRTDLCVVIYESAPRVNQSFFCIQGPAGAAFQRYFAFDEVLPQGNLDARPRLMVQVASMIASQALREYCVMLGAALTAGDTPLVVENAPLTKSLARRL